MDPLTFIILSILAIMVVLGVYGILITIKTQKNEAYPLLPPPLSPEIIHTEQDEQGRKHCLNNYAVKWDNGKTEYWVHGVEFSKELFTNLFVKRNYTPEQILNMRNAEQKSMAIRVIGYDYIVNSLKDYKILDEETLKSKVTHKPLKYQVIEFPITNDVTVRVVKVQDHTTGKIACLGVPRIPSTRNCMGAIAWTFNMDIWEYDPEVEA